MDQDSDIARDASHASARGAVGGSFRDPAGFVFRRDGVLYRQLNRRAAASHEALMSSGLYAELTRCGLLLPHEDAPLALALSGEAWKVIRPEPLRFVSYPYEWCFSQLQDAARLTLEVQRRALAAGMSLRDASAYNVQLHDGRPVFIDTLSFETYAAGRPWVAYRQFCQHFLAPLALMSRRDVRLGRLLQLHLDGIPLDLASRLLPWSSRLSVGLGIHVHAHARSQRRHAADGAAAAGAGRSFSRAAFDAWIASLESAVTGLAYRPDRGTWREYYEIHHNYGTAGLAEKERVVSSFLGALRPATCWDLGANVGRFSRIASERGIFTVAWDFDAACVEAGYRLARERGERRFLPLLLDLANPSPAVGWDLRERQSMAERGPADLVLALGLVHHLAIANNVPLADVAGFLARLGGDLIVEFVPKDDSQVRRLLASREDIFPDYTQGGFEAAFARAFAIEERTAIAGTGRWLYRMSARRARPRPAPSAAGVAAGRPTG